MVQVPNNFLFSGDDAVASYNYEDLFARTGYLKFYLCSAGNSSTTDFLLTPLTVQGSPRFYNVGTSTELNFDYEFNSQKVIKGDLIVSVALEIYASGAASMYCDYTVYHVTEGGTETSLGTLRGLSATTSGSGQCVRDCCKIAIARTVFKKGEKLRLSVLATTGGSGISWRAVYTDPANSVPAKYPDNYSAFSVSYPDTDSFILVPFPIDL